MAELKNYTPYISIKIPLVLVNTIVAQLSQSDATRETADGLAKAMEDVLSGEHTIECKVLGLVDRLYKHRVSDYMSIVGDLAKLSEANRNSTIAYSIKKVN